MYCHCDGSWTGSSISDQNWIKNREDTASRFTLPRLYWQMNQQMNEHQSLLFCSLPVCPFLILSFQGVCFWEKNPSARLCMVSFHSMLALEFQGTWIWKKNSNIILTFRISSWNPFEYLCQSTQRRISGATFFFFWRSIRIPFENFGAPVEVQHSKFPSPACRLIYRSPVSAVSSCTCKGIAWDKCYLWKCASCAVHCKPD